MELTHFNEQGRARMVDVTGKAATYRTARAAGAVHMKKETQDRIREGRMAKGDVLEVAQVAGIMAAKKSHELIPMCHPLLLTGIDLEFRFSEEPCRVEIFSTVKCHGETGVEMEALTAVSVAALTIYDMCKAVQKDMHIENIHLLSKTGGKSGTYTAEELGIVTAVNISEKKGVRKHEVPYIDLKCHYGILGDAHAGDWHRQVSLLAEESVDKMRALGLDNLTPGAFAENISTRGIDLKSLPVGTKLKIGEVLTEVTQIGKECHNDCAIKKATGQCVMPTEGIFVIVLRGGRVQKGDPVKVIAE